MFLSFSILDKSRHSIKIAKTGKNPLAYRENRLPTPQTVPYNKDCNLLSEILCNPPISTNFKKSLGSDR